MNRQFTPPTEQEMINELKKQFVEEQYYQEAFEIIPRRMELNQCTLKEAVEFIVYWVHRIRY